MKLPLFAIASLLVAFYSVQGRPEDSDDDDGSSNPVDPDEQALGLPSSSKSIRPNLANTFSCDGRSYGYYADTDNDCEVFHICHPVVMPDGEEVMYKYSFICPNQTVFDQSTLVCTFPLDALPCDESPNFYEGPDSINGKFGVVDAA